MARSRAPTRRPSPPGTRTSVRTGVLSGHDARGPADALRRARGRAQRSAALGRPRAADGTQPRRVGRPPARAGCDGSAALFARAGDRRPLARRAPADVRPRGRRAPPALLLRRGRPAPPPAARRGPRRAERALRRRARRAVPDGRPVLLPRRPGQRRLARRPRSAAAAPPTPWSRSCPSGDARKLVAAPRTAAAPAARCPSPSATATSWSWAAPASARGSTASRSPSRPCGPRISIQFRPRGVL